MVILFQRRLVIVFAFILLSTGSAVYLLTATLNYNRLYPAIAQLTANTTTVTVIKGSPPDRTKLFVEVTIVNPTDYSGFKLLDVSVTLSHPQTNESFLAQTQTIGNQTVTNT